MAVWLREGDKSDEKCEYSGKVLSPRGGFYHVFANFRKIVTLSGNVLKTSCKKCQKTLNYTFQKTSEKSTCRTFFARGFSGRAVHVASGQVA